MNWKGKQFICALSFKRHNMQYGIITKVQHLVIYVLANWNKMAELIILSKIWNLQYPEVSWLWTKFKMCIFSNSFIQITELFFLRRSIWSKNGNDYPALLKMPLNSPPVWTPWPQPVWWEGDWWWRWSPTRNSWSCLRSSRCWRCNPQRSQRLYLCRIYTKSSSRSFCTNLIHLILVCMVRLSLYSIQIWMWGQFWGATYFFFLKPWLYMYITTLWFSVQL